MARNSFSLACAVLCALALPARAAETASPAASLSAYRTYATAQAELLARMIRVLATDIGDGNLEAARNDYAMTRKYLERIRPLLALQGELARRMDAAAADFPDKERDPGFTGFHRIEYGLFARGTMEGLDVQVERLRGDASALREAVATQPLAFDVLLDAPAKLVETVSARVASGGREPYSQTDLWDIEANVEGAREIVAALGPQIAARDPTLMPRINAAFEATGERLSQLRDGCGFKAFDQLTRAEKAGLEESATALARELARLRKCSVAGPEQRRLVGVARGTRGESRSARAPQDGDGASDGASPLRGAVPAID